MNGYETEHNAVMRRFGAECTVLLKTDGAFPLEGPCSVALYGSGARRTVKGGTGSGEVNSRRFVTAEDGLEEAGFTVTSKEWMDGYDEVRAQAHKRFIKQLKRSALKRGTLAILTCMGAVMPEPEYDLPLSAGGEAAVYVLSRISGEGSDRSPVPGDILLTETEKRDILELDRRFERFLLVLNVGGPVDLSPVTEVRNVLLLSQLGGETGNILADIMLGRSEPSGRLTTTWAAWADRPDTGDFGGRYDTRYKEGVYVGYRWFEAKGKKPLFPFGYGLSFTRFEMSAGAASVRDGVISIPVTVGNVGERSGRQVVQLYVSQPQGRLGKPVKILAAFGKTGELQPGEKETLTLSFDMRDAASYDEARAAWILEAGDYVLMPGSSSADAKAAAAIRLDSDAIVKKVKNCLGKPDFADWEPGCRSVSADGLPVIPVEASAFTAETVRYGYEEEPDAAAEGMTDEELCLINIGAFKRSGAKSVIGNAANSVAGAAGETSSCPGVPPMIMADGPAGLRLSRLYYRDGTGAHPIGGGMPESMTELMPAPAAFAMKLIERGKKPEGAIFEQNCTAIPIGTALAQSWDIRFAEICGDTVGDEMERFGVHLWLAPALNIHRDIRCGRNFEYYSEDPLISGSFAAAVARGVQRHPGCGVTIKHFAANNQETNRYGSNSMASERALREVYLRGFEIAVRDGAPRAVMTSYNLINGVHTSERRGLTQDVLRSEFGFRGIVMTDWIIGALNMGAKKYPAPNAARIAAAGGDLVMPGGRSDLKAMLKGLKSGAVTRWQLVINASRVIRTARLLNAKERPE
ncbi:MAG: glycoside hydrolase family 3 C-terminal domain-containing protein [Clostridia bacterium]|nr:glycoside hydrolase family 3 C-terminal domain-containing protein [Clostridia bacterium]